MYHLYNIEQLCVRFALHCRVKLLLGAQRFGWTTTLLPRYCDASILVHMDLPQVVLYYFWHGCMHDIKDASSMQALQEEDTYKC